MLLEGNTKRCTRVTCNKTMAQKEVGEEKTEMWSVQKSCVSDRW